ncbi:MAG: ABC transporter ATP-binding protein [Prevotellaceae bacterium]|jgi:ABC-type multidrug transport system ATPase subunit|nr:ABC transporter ATP-binding protein [Prevotellaceae bacterium]
MITITNISKSYGKVQALKNVGFEVSRGELFGLIGPDGAGKTSLMRILATLILPDSGSASIAGRDVVKDYRYIRNNIGYMPGRFSLYQDLSMEENLQFFATIFGTTIKENYELIKPIYSQIEPFKKRKAGALSGGMKQKLALSCALIHRPEALILDEPTTGVDAVSRTEFWEMLKELKRYDITIIVSTPYMDEAGLCDRVALIQSGNILQVDTPQNIVNSYKGKLYAIKAQDIYQLNNLLRQHTNIESCFTFGEFLHIVFKNDSSEQQAIVLDYLENQGMKNIVVQPINPNIEDCFIQLLQ